MPDESNFGLGDVEESGSGPGTGVGVVRVGKRDYAIGLYWASASEPSTLAREAREAAARPDMEASFYCSHAGVTPQYGLGFKAIGHKSGMPSLAAHVASAKSGSWVGLFEVPGGYYLIAVRDDSILSESDRFIPDARQAREALRQFVESVEWNEEIAPASFRIDGSSEIRIETLVEGRPPSRLTDVSRSRNALKYGIAALLVLGPIVGLMTYMDFAERQRLEEELNARARQAVEVFAPKEEIQIPPMPWEGKPLAARALEACVREALGFPLDIPGWDVVAVYCTGDGMDAHLERVGNLEETGGAVTWIRPFLDKPGFEPRIAYGPSGSDGVAQVSWDVKGLPRIPADIRTLAAAPTQRAMQELLESRLTPVAFSPADSNDFWKGFAFDFSTREDPRSFGDLIGAIPATIIDRIEYDVPTGTWKIQGTVYEQLPLPQNPSS